MRYTGIERLNDSVYATLALYNSQPHVPPQANDKDRSNPFRTKKKELKAGPDGIIYYTVGVHLTVILVPETHPLFNYPLLIHGAKIFKRLDASQDVKSDLVDMLKNFAKQIVA